MHQMLLFKKSSFPLNGVTCLLCSPTKSAHLIELTKPPGGVMHPMGALKLTNYILLFLRGKAEDELYP